MFKPPPQPHRRGTALRVAIAALVLGYAAVVSGWLLSIL